MRKLQLLVVHVAMVAGGLYLLVAGSLWPTKDYGWMIFVGAMLVTLGSCLLRTDFIAAPFTTKNDSR